LSIPLHIVLRCADALVPKARYVFDTLFMAAGVPVVYVTQPPPIGVWLDYGTGNVCESANERRLAIVHSPDSWTIYAGHSDVSTAEIIDGLHTVFPERGIGSSSEADISFDIVANAFYFLSSWSERVGSDDFRSRRMYTSSVYARLGIPQDIVDQYLRTLMTRLQSVSQRNGRISWSPLAWPQNSQFALVLTHDIDYIPENLLDTLMQGAKTMYRHLVRQRDPVDAIVAMFGLARALSTGRDPYGCLPAIIAREKKLGVRASFQVAVGHRHPRDVKYRIESDRIKEYLEVIVASGCDLCLHGSYRSTENSSWYAEEVALLSQRLGKPTGSRQHFLSFDYDVLFAAQERTGIRFDMSMGYPDRTGPRAGFSYPYFPYCLDEDRPYDVVEISLFMMDVTLRGYMGLKGRRARNAIETEINALREKRGCVSTVWHPIVFGSARDPGYDRMFWEMVDRVRDSGGVATDGATIDAFWRKLAGKYASFSHLASRADTGASN
jgi:hypothetical protein